MMKPKKRPACDLLFPSDKMRKGIVGNNRKAEINVVNVKPQSRKNCEVNKGESGTEESADVIRRFSWKFRVLAGLVGYEPCKENFVLVPFGHFPRKPPVP